MAQVITVDVFHALSPEQKFKFETALKSLPGVNFDHCRGASFHDDIIVVEQYKADENGNRYIDRLTNDVAVAYLQFDRVRFDDATEVVLNEAWLLSVEMNEGVRSESVLDV